LAAIRSFGRRVRAGTGQANELGSADTSDLHTGISRHLDQYLWFLEAHLQTKR
jgi:starvation-inducible DNA-binding protein